MISVLIFPVMTGIFSFAGEAISSGWTWKAWRNWFINADGTDMRCAKAQKENEMISHEYWLSDGSRMAYVYRTQDKPVNLPKNL